MVELDDLDRRILKELLKNSNRSYRALARCLGVAVTTVINRIQRLEELGVITGYTISVDYEKLGYELTVITEITVSKGKLLEMEREIAEIPSVCAVYDVTGLTDAMIIAKFRNRRELSKFTKGLLSMPFIERTNTHVVLTTVKEDFRLIEMM
ncbi:AsnC family transcriptional regulator [Candidatus Bathyarchaeota archaeon]|nr:MAG: Lrp/AsnC family transcriptional regulator [Candidatus Bathyarchaeota archaeon]RLI31982.1 MAG: AsnC family transcriptional regulator [Candidatus Bathyarchaeota archaeon]